MELAQALTAGGLLLDLIGAALIGRAFFVSKRETGERVAARWATKDPLRNAESLPGKMAMVDRNFGLAGTGFLMLGFLLQFAAVFAK